MSQYQVMAPDRGFSGESCGVVFRDGAAVVSPATKERRAALEYFRRRGYTVTQVVEDEPQQGKRAAGPAESAAPFDPSEHPADEVLTYLDSLVNEDTHDAAEFDRVLAAEQSGKARKTILARAGAHQQGDQA